MHAPIVPDRTYTTRMPQHIFNRTEQMGIHFITLINPFRGAGSVITFTTLSMRPHVACSSRSGLTLAVSIVPKRDRVVITGSLFTRVKRLIIISTFTFHLTAVSIRTCFYPPDSGKCSHGSTSTLIKSILTCITISFQAMKQSIPANLCVMYICSRARAAVNEAKTDIRKLGPDSYYTFWKARMNLDLVSSSRQLCANK